METVLYKRNPNYPNLFCGTNGQVFSLKARRFLKYSINVHGYAEMSAFCNGKQRTCLVHRLIIGTFKGCSNLTVDHVNEIKTDNRLENLEYVTREENLKRSWVNNPKRGVVHTGENNHNSKLKEKDIKDIREMSKLGHSQSSIASKYSLGKTTINCIINRITWVHVD